MGKLCPSPSVELNEERIKIDENSSEVALQTTESAISSDQGVFICLPLIKVRLQPGYERENIPIDEKVVSERGTAIFATSAVKFSRISYLYCDSHSLRINIDSISISRFCATTNIVAVSIDSDPVILSFETIMFPSNKVNNSRCLKNDRTLQYRLTSLRNLQMSSNALQDIQWENYFWIFDVSTQIKYCPILFLKNFNTGANFRQREKGSSNERGKSPLPDS